MYWKRFSAFLQHRLKAKTRHGTHSPYVYEFLEKVLYDDAYYQAYKQLDDLLNDLKKDRKLLEYEDLGARKERKRVSVSQLAKTATAGKKFARLLFRINQHYQFDQCLELGTNLGIGSAALALGNPLGKLTSLEGVDALCEIARDNFKSLGIKERIELVHGNFDDNLEEVLDRFKSIDLVFLDGNHRYEPSMRYFKAILPKLHNDSWLIIDDIHWSTEMEDAWNEMRKHPSVKVDIDLFRFGILLFRKEMTKEHFYIRF